MLRHRIITCQQIAAGYLGLPRGLSIPPRALPAEIDIVSMEDLGQICAFTHTFFLVAKVGEGEPGHPHPDPVFQVDTRFTCVRRHSMPSVEKVLDLKRVSGLRQMFRWRSHHNRSRLNLRGL